MVEFRVEYAKWDGLLELQQISLQALAATGKTSQREIYQEIMARDRQKRERR
jgi:hypothetical protein